MATSEKGKKPLICLRDLSNYNEETMPTSPVDTKPSSLSPGTLPMSRPLSASSAISGVPSPHHLAPSPPENTAISEQQLPPACGARQLSKLKRFLTTLQQFGSDISAEIGDRVRMLVLALVNSHLSIEEFHSKLQEATNFPLRPFVIPFLKANLPLLQRELLQCARLAKQSTQQYLAQNPHILFDVSSQHQHPAVSSAVPDTVTTAAGQLNENGKRTSPDRAKENGVDSGEPAAKRSASLTSPPVSHVSPGQQLCGPLRLEDMSLSRELRERERLERMEQERIYNNYNYHRNEHAYLDRMEDDWKHVESMLHCIVGMVDKCKRTLNALRERGQRDREELALWTRHYGGVLTDGDNKKRTADIVASTLRQTEERVMDVKRRAEEAVNEVKRQAVAELQKAVVAAEAKAGEMVASERDKMERVLAETRQQAQTEALSAVSQQDDSSESCWNCGRKASETCSGCNVARYCGSFCQHKDWENHHRVCAQVLATRPRSAASNRQTTSSTPTPPPVATAAPAAVASSPKEQSPAASPKPEATQ